jgi:hypothetical protein
MPKWRGRRARKEADDRAAQAHHERSTGSDGEATDWSDVGEAALVGADALAHSPIAFAVVVLAIPLVLGLWFFVLPAVVLLVDVLFLVFVAAIGAAIRVLFRRPWDVVAQTVGPPAERVDLPVVGWRASGEYVDEVAWRIEQTGSPLEAPPGTPL